MLISQMSYWQFFSFAAVQQTAMSLKSEQTSEHRYSVKIYSWILLLKLKYLQNFSSVTNTCSLESVDQTIVLVSSSEGTSYLSC